MYKFLDRMRNRAAVFTHDLLMIPLCWLAAYWFQFNLTAIPEPDFRDALVLLPFVMAVQGGIFWYFGLYRSVWRFASVPDLVRILKAVAVGVAIFTALVFLFNRLDSIPRSTLPLYAVFLMTALGGPRIIYRWLKDRNLYQRKECRVVVVGAGEAGEMFVREALRHPEQPYEPVAFVDDRREQLGKEIHGVRVVGQVSDLPKVVKNTGADLVVIAIPSATSDQMRRITDICNRCGVPVRTLPRVRELIPGQVSAETVREVSLEDLLEREPVRLEWDKVQAGISDQVVLVSGGGGSIGSELCRQIIALKPRKLVVFERSEYNLYRIEQELLAVAGRERVQFVLGDVGDPGAVERLFAVYRPAVVFHAAAYKHVPLLEGQMREAIRNNVLGTRQLGEAAARYGAGVFAYVSTDKAVNPANVMGASKRIAEMLCQDLNEKAKTRFVTVRFGNVLGSAGSVTPFFERQIEAGGPVTVTHPEVSRYFMTQTEACQLILEAAVVGAGGEIFVLDMGEPVKIRFLAEQMIRMAGKEPGRDIDLVYTGMRPGEKLHEELFHEHEHLQTTGHEKILLARHRQVDFSVVDACLKDMAEACDTYDEERLMRLVAGLVPEYRPGTPMEPDKVVIFNKAKSG